LTQAAIYERRGWLYRQGGEDTRAQVAFKHAVETFDKAEKLLRACGPGADPDKRAAAIERLAVRRTKCRLLSNDQMQAGMALKELAGYTQLTDTRPVQLYNTACLFAVAMACPNLSSEQQKISEWRAWRYLGHALVLGGHGSSPWSRMTTDEELDALNADRRKAFRAELQKRHDGDSPIANDLADPIVEGAMLMLGLTNPVP
jgi:hypothetical protein